MVTNHICTECSSTDVEVRGWIHLNNNKTDSSSAENLDDYWCNTCEAHSEIIYRKYFAIGETVLWKDPEHISSGIYTVIKKITECEAESIYLIKNEFSEAEVTENELRETQTSIENGHS